MKLPIKKVYFDAIKNNLKSVEFRDAHLTFVCEETGEELRKDIVAVHLRNNIRNKYPDVLKDPWTLCFVLEK